MTDPKIAKVISLAKEANGAKVTRADLAYELKELGVEEDSIEVSKLVWEAYSTASKAIASLIASTYISNTSSTTVIDEYASKHYLNGGDTSSALSHIDNNASLAGKGLDALTDIINKQMPTKASPKQKDGLLAAGLNKITGTSGVQEVKANATAVVQRYTDIINVYEGAKTEVQDVMNDFVDIRGDVLKNYDKYAMMLTDFFGDSIKGVAPVLFDFDSVEYLNTQEMLKNVVLKYDKLTEDCTILISEISEGFSNTLQHASQVSKGVSKGFGLAIAATSVLSHYLGASEKTARMQMELDKLKMNVKHDVVTIKGDYARLATIYKTINDLYIPKANAYYKYGGKVFDAEFKKLLDVLYADAGVKAMVEERNKILDERKELCDLINDHKENIAYYEENISHCTEIKEARQGDYDEAIAQRPQAPSVIVNIFTLGQAKKKYNRHIYDWNSSYRKVVKEYENLDISIKTDTVELDDHKKELQSLESELKNLNKDIKSKTERIMTTINVAPEMKKQLAKHLGDIIQLLYIAKDIIQSGLDERQIKTVKMKEYKDNELPEDVKNAIQSFTNAMSGIVADNVDKISNSIAMGITEAQTAALIAEKVRKDHKRNVNGADKQQANNTELPQAEMPSEATIAAMSDATMMAAQSGVQLMGTLAELAALREKNKITSQEYDKKLQEFKSQFKQDMQAIDNKSQVLNEILKKINTASDNEELKNALLLLADGNDVFGSDKDIEEFLKGNKTINI